MSQANYSLRLQASLKTAAEKLAKREGTTLNQFINVAVAEKIAALETEDLLRRRAERGDPQAALAWLRNLPGKEKPRAGDQVD